MGSVKQLRCEQRTLSVCFYCGDKDRVSLELSFDASTKHRPLFPLAAIGDCQADRAL